MKRKIIILIIILILFSSSFAIDTLVNHTKSKSNEQKEIKKEIQEIDNKTENFELIENHEEVVDDNKKISSDKQENKNETSVQKNDNKKQSSNITRQDENNVSITKNENVHNEQKQEQPKIEIWEQLGMTKDQYYNKPMYNWEHVDFSVEQFGDESKAKQACLNYGDNYQPYLNGEVSYNCSTVTSASGKYLGEMFYTEKLS